jgi:hypothetical protein
VGAGATANVGVSREILGYHFSSNRRPEFTKETVFCSAKSGEIEISHESLIVENQSLSASAELGGEHLRFKVDPKASYVSGRPLSQDFSALITQNAWTHESLSIYLKSYLAALVRVGALSDSASPATMIMGRFIDCIPSNLIVRDDGMIQFIDTEWSISGSITVKRLLFRALLSLISLPSEFSLDSFGRAYTHEEFFKLCYRLLDYDLNETELLTLFDEEMTLQKAVSDVCHEREYVLKLLKTALPRKKYYDITPGYIRQVAHLSHELNAITKSRKWRLAVKISEMVPRFIKHAVRKALSPAN